MKRQNKAKSMAVDNRIIVLVSLLIGYAACGGMPKKQADRINNELMSYYRVLPHRFAEVLFDKNFPIIQALDPFEKPLAESPLSYCCMRHE